VRHRTNRKQVDLINTALDSGDGEEALPIQPFVDERFRECRHGFHNLTVNYVASRSASEQIMLGRDFCL
jgi:hypothetical protein